MLTSNMYVAGLNPDSMRGTPGIACRHTRPVREQGRYSSTTDFTMGTPQMASTDTDAYCRASGRERVR